MNKMISNAELRKRILNRLADEPFFNNYSVVNSNLCLINKDRFGKFAVSIAHSYTSVDLERESMFSLQVNPSFLRRFDILENWYEDIILCNKSARRYRYSAEWTPPFDKKYRSGWYYVDFLREIDTFEDDYQRLRAVILDAGIPFFEQYESLEGMFQNDIQTVLEGVAKFPIHGFDWAPRYLVLTKITHPECYSEVKELILSTFKTFDSWGEPNYMLYKNRISDIFKYIETNDFEVNIATC